MTVVLDAYTIPEMGEFEIYVKRTVSLQVTAEAARRKVHSWLLHDVSYMMGAEAPQLVIGRDSVVWRVPVVLTATHVGRVGVVGHVDLAVETGEFDSSARSKAQIVQCALELAAKLPPYQPQTEMPAGYEPITAHSTARSGRPDGDPLDLLPASVRLVYCCQLDPSQL